MTATASAPQRRVRSILGNLVAGQYLLNDGPAHVMLILDPTGVRTSVLGTGVEVTGVIARLRARQEQVFSAEAPCRDLVRDRTCRAADHAGQLRACRSVISLWTARGQGRRSRRAPTPGSKPRRKARWQPSAASGRQSVRDLRAGRRDAAIGSCLRLTARVDHGPAAGGRGFAADPPTAAT
jgi:hypothetical protein